MATTSSSNTSSTNGGKRRRDAETTTTPLTRGRPRLTTTPTRGATTPHSAASTPGYAAPEVAALPCAFGLLCTRRYLPMLVGHAGLLTPKIGLDRLRVLTERPGWVRRVDGVEEEADVFYKYAPMLDGEYFLLGRYDVAERIELPSHARRAFVSRHAKIMDPMNSAAMDALGAHLSGELYREGLPTALETYGYRVGLKQRFSFDVGATCMALCNEWDTPENARRFSWSKKPDDFDKRKADLLAARKEREEEHQQDEEQAEVACQVCGTKGCLGDCCADDLNYDDYGGEEEEDDYDDWASYDAGEALVDLHRIPVVMVAIERCSGGTLEDLLVDRQKCGRPFSEEETAALAMQLMFTLAAFQERYQMVHGDLHMRNIMVVPATETEVHFSFDGTVHSVPTFGRKYKIIDFGRSAFVVDGRTFVSDAFMPYGDGAGMYNCGAGEDRRFRTVAPGPSFDLGLLSGPLFEILVGDDFMADWEESAMSATSGAAAAFFEKNTTPAQRAIFAWGTMGRAPAEEEGAAARKAAIAASTAALACDPELSGEMAEEEEEEYDEEEEEAKEEEGGAGDKGGDLGGGNRDDAAFMLSLERFDPAWEGQHTTLLGNGAPRFNKNLLFRVNQLCARHVHRAVPADLLRYYLMREEFSQD